MVYMVDVDGRGGSDFSLTKLIVIWSRGFLVRDIGWEYMALKSGLLRLFLIDVFVRLRDDSMVCPLSGFEGEGNIEFRADGLDGNSLVSNWQFYLQPGLT